MSTVGKVLVFLIALPTLGWIWLAAGLAELNRNYGKQTAETASKIQAAADETVATGSDVYLQKGRIAQVQREKENRLTSQRSQISQLYSVDSFTKETLDRYAIQYTSMQQGEQSAQGRLALAERVLAATRKELSDAQAELAALKDANARDRETLAQLRQDLMQTLEENKQLVERSREGVRTPTPSARAIPTGTARSTR
jgi:chromosome segregation ATPase